MKTITLNNSKIQGHDCKDLFVGLTNITNEIEKMVENTTYIDNSGETKKLYQLSSSISTLDYMSATLLGICDRKRLRNNLNRLNKGVSLFYINKLFRLIHKTKLFSTEKVNPVKIFIPKHELIQSKRKKMLEFKSQYEQALKDYKEEKGSFYKNLK